MSICSTTALILHLVSIHGSPGFNNVNPGVGVECGINTHLSAGIGVYQNSQSRPSFYVGTEVKTEVYRGFEVGVLVGAATGYLRAPIVPIGGLVLHSPTVNGWQARLLYGPKVKETTEASVLHLFLSKAF